MEFTRYWGQAGGAEEARLEKPHPSPRRCALAAPPSPKWGRSKEEKETPGPAGAGAEGHRKKNIFIISQNAGSVKEIDIGTTVFWPCCRDVLEGDVVGEMMDFSTGEKLLAVLSYGGVSWFRPDRLCRTAAEARKRIERSFLSGLEVTGKAERP